MPSICIKKTMYIANVTGEIRYVKESISKLRTQLSMKLGWTFQAILIAWRRKTVYVKASRTYQILKWKRSHSYKSNHNLQFNEELKDNL